MVGDSTVDAEIHCAAINEESDGRPGDIALATPAPFTLTPIAPGAPTITQTAATCGVGVGGNHYAGSGGAALTVYDPSLGFVTGGGTIVRGGNTAYWVNLLNRRKNFPMSGAY